MVPTKEQIDTKVVLTTIKDAIRSKGIPYKDLAGRLGMSESGLKKIFIAEDCSFNRLNQICEAVDLSMADILSTLKTSAAKDVRFTPEQEEFFIRNMSYFQFLWKLLYERLSVAEIQMKFALSERRVFQFLKKLDELKLLELHAGNRIKLPKIELVRWAGNGPLLKKIRKEWSARLIRDVIDQDIKSDQHFSLRSYQLTAESMQDLLRAFKEIDREFGKRSVREMVLHKGKLHFIRTVSAVAEGSFVEALEV